MCEDQVDVALEELVEALNIAELSPQDGVEICLDDSYSLDDVLYLKEALRKWLDRHGLSCIPISVWRDVN